MPGDLSALAQQVLLRQMAEADAASRVMPSGPLVPNRSQPMTPLASGERLGLLGGALDAASTYAFLKRGTGHEANAAFANHSPAATALLVGGEAAGTSALRSLFRRHVPATTPLADLLATMQGAYQIGLAGNNLRDKLRPSSDDRYLEQTRDAITRRR